MHLTRRDWALLGLASGGAACLAALLRFLLPGVSAEGAAFAGVAAVGVLILEVYRRLLGAVGRAADEPNINYRQIEALLSLHRLLDLRRALPPLRGASVAPDFALAVVELIQDLRPRSIVELGSGASTIVVAAMLRQCAGGNLLSLEQEATYATQVQQQLVRHELQAFARVIHAPLVNVPVGDTIWPWYDTSLLPEMKNVDLLLIDGPRQQNNRIRLARYPALPLLRSALGPGAVIVLDDADREDERRIVARWLREFPDLELERRPSEKGTTILRRRPSSTQAGDNRRT